MKKIWIWLFLGLLLLRAGSVSAQLNAPLRIQDSTHMRRLMGDQLISEVYHPRHSKLTERGLAFSVNILYFYTALAIAEHASCYIHQDPTLCRAFMKSLEDPGTYFGFYSFMKAAGYTSFQIQKMAKIGGFASMGGLAAGMMVSDLFHSVYDDPDFKKLISISLGKSRVPENWHEERTKILQKMWKEKYSNPEWWLDKAPSIISLWGAAGLSYLSLKAAGTAFDAARSGVVNAHRLLSKTEHSTATALAGVAAKRMNQVHHIAKDFHVIKGIRMFWKWGEIFRVNPVVYIGGHIVEILVFETYSRLLDEPLKKLSDMTQAKWELKQAGQDLIGRSDWEQNPESLNPSLLANPEILKKKVDRLKAAWDRIRRVPLSHMVMNTQRFAAEGNQIYKQLNQYRVYYSWIAQGMNPKTQITDENGVKFSLKTQDFREHLTNFFCAALPKDAIHSPAKLGPWTFPIHFDWVEGVPVPRMNGIPIRISPFRALIAGEEKEIPKEICDPATRDSVESRVFRIRWVRQHDSFKLLQSALAMVDARLTEERNKLFEIYEAQAKENAVKLFFGSRERLGSWYQSVADWADVHPADLQRDVVHDPLLAKDTFAGRLSQERAFWWRLHKKFSASTKIFWDANYDNLQKSMAVAEVTAKLLNPSMKSETSEEDAIVRREKTYPNEAWAKIVRELDSLVLD